MVPDFAFAISQKGVRLIPHPCPPVPVSYTHLFFSPAFHSCLQQKLCRFNHLFPRATSQSQASLVLATAARVKYPAALQRCKFNTPSACSGVFDCCLTEKTAGVAAVFSAYRYLCRFTGCPCHKFLPKRGEHGYAWKRIPAEEASAHREGS